MTEIRPESPLSSTELVVLACLLQTKTPSAESLSKVVLELCMPGEPLAHAGTAVATAIHALRERALVADAVNAGSNAKKVKKKAKPNSRKNQVTATGEQALCAALGLARTPTWSDVRDKHLPALGLGLQPGSAAAAKVMGSVVSIETVVLRTKLGVENVTTIPDLCDLLIAEQLGMAAGPVTLERMRAHVLALRLGVAGGPGKLTKVAAMMAADLVAATRADPPEAKRRMKALVRALGRRALRGASGADAATQPSSSAAATKPPELWRVPQTPVPRPVTTAQPAAPDIAALPAAPPDEDLLEVVREAIPQVGADGRFGPEKVFVSALWHRIEHVRRPPDLSFDGFKRWLVTANRDGWLVLARADLVGAMDARQVAESEIRDRNATFHFVLDAQRGNASHGGVHVR